MKYLKLFESFDVVMPEETKNIVSEWGLTMDDIEELFLEFSDMGYDIQIMPYSQLSMSGKSVKKKELIVYIKGLSEDESYSPEISGMLRQIIRSSNRLGLYTPSKKSLRQLYPWLFYTRIDSPSRVYGSRSIIVKFIFNKS